MVTVGGPRLRKAAETALAGTGQDVATFVTAGWKTPLEQDQRVLVSQIAQSGGPHTEAAALAASDKPGADVQAFLDETRFTLRDSDDRIEVSQLAESGGPATEQAAQIALEGNGGDPHLPGSRPATPAGRPAHRRRRRQEVLSDTPRHRPGSPASFDSRHRAGRSAGAKGGGSMCDPDGMCHDTCVV